jgi:hypothetical protein
MPVNTSCAEYNANRTQWDIVRDAVAGDIAIKAKGETYLPRPSGQTNDDYKGYAQRAVFADLTSRTAEGLHGHIFAKDPVQTGELSDAFKKLLKNVDAAGTGIDQFGSDITWDAMQTCWGGILVDHVPVAEGTPLAKVRGGAFLKWYAAESVINWRYAVVKKNGVNKLVLVVLREDRIEESAADEFVTETIERYRVLSFDENGHYVQRIFERSGSGTEFIIVETISPKIDGEPFDEIPFFVCPGKSPEKSMLLGLAQENIGHYQKTADYENGLHYTGVPTPVAENMMPPKDEETGKDIDVKLGGSSFLFFYSVDKAVNVKYLEFTGAGLGQLLQALNATLDRMAKLGIQAIGAEKKGVETAEVAAIHRASENGVLGAFARNMSDRITQAVRLMARWNSIPEAETEAWSYELNTNFNYSEMSAQILSIMLTARQNNEIPRIAWFNTLKQNGKLPENMTFEEFVETIEADRTGPHGPDGEERAVA